MTLFGGPTKAEKRSDPLYYLPPGGLEAFAKLLAYPSPKSKTQPQRDKEWVDGQLAQISSFDRSLKILRSKSPATFFAHDQYHACRLCRSCSHDELRPELVFWCYTKLVEEVSLRMDRWRDYRDKYPDEITPGLEAFIDRVTSIATLYLYPDQFDDKFGQRCIPQSLRLERVKNSCAACVLAVIGCRGQMLIDLRANMLARGYRTTPRLLLLIEAWMNDFPIGMPRELRDESDELAMELVCMKERINVIKTAKEIKSARAESYYEEKREKRRRGQREKQQARDELARLAQSIISSLKEKLLLSMGPVGSLFRSGSSGSSRSNKSSERRDSFSSSRRRSVSRHDNGDDDRGRSRDRSCDRSDGPRSSSKSSHRSSSSQSTIRPSSSHGNDRPSSSHSNHRTSSPSDNSRALVRSVAPVSEDDSDSARRPVSAMSKGSMDTIIEGVRFMNYYDKTPYDSYPADDNDDLRPHSPRQSSSSSRASRASVQTDIVNGVLGTHHDRGPSDVANRASWTSSVYSTDSSGYRSGDSGYHGSTGAGASSSSSSSARRSLTHKPSVLDGLNLTADDVPLAPDAIADVSDSEDEDEQYIPARANWPGHYDNSGDNMTCPICDRKLAGLSVEEGSAHAKACLDARMLRLAATGGLESLPEDQAVRGSSACGGSRESRPYRLSVASSYSSGGGGGNRPSAQTEVRAGDRERDSSRSANAYRRSIASEGSVRVSRGNPRASVVGGSPDRGRESRRSALEGGRFTNVVRST